MTIYEIFVARHLERVYTPVEDTDGSVRLSHFSGESRGAEPLWGMSVSHELVRIVAGDLAQHFGGKLRDYEREIAKSLIRSAVWS